MKALKSYAAGVFTTLLIFGLIGSVSAKVGKVTRELEYRNIQVSLDGKTLDLRNAAGEKVEPFMFDGTNYLPVRALAEALGLRVSWDGAHATVVLTTPAAAAAITEAEAKRIALAHAGLSESAVTFVSVRLDNENGKTVYEVEFYSAQKEYDYEIDASSGEILSFDREAEYRSAAESQNAAASGAQIGAERAKAIALAHAGQSESQVTGLRAKLEREDGQMIYEVEFRVGRTEYHYDIDASGGKVVSYEIDND
ncbi:MAG: PepSY domain-containing protein [Oscillibacter sp.]|nr:PepSY domain-containing protein [Oscillibacter sp.]